MPVSKIGTNALSSGLDVSSTNISYTGTLTGGTGVVNIGSGQVYKDASGNVGIGTSSPVTLKSATTLQVNGNAKLGNANDRGLLSLGDVASSGANCGIWRGAAGAYGSAGNYLSLGGYDGITFTTGNADIASQTERARIDSSGNLLVGTTSSIAKLTLNGVAGSNQQTLFGGGWGSGIGAFASLTAANTSNADVIYFNTSAANVGKIAITSTATSYVTSSDYRLKENVQPMTGALAKVALLKPCTYTWKFDGSAGEGFIAHELAEVVPDAVTGEKDAVDADGNIKPQGIDTSFLVATLTAAIQELKAELDSVKAELAVLKGV